MEIVIRIKCDSIGEFGAHLTKLAQQVKRTARKQKLDSLRDEFSKEHEPNLCDNNCYGTHDVEIHEDGATKEAKEIFMKFIDTQKHGENPDAEKLWNFCFGEAATADNP